MNTQVQYLFHNMDIILWIWTLLCFSVLILGEELYSDSSILHIPKSDKQTN